MRIAVEAAGPDAAAVAGAALRAVREDGAQVLLFGPAQRLAAALNALGGASERGVTLVDVQEPPQPEEQACPLPAQSAILRAASTVACAQADALVSTGKASAAMAAAMRHLKRLPGLLRPALLCTLPTARGTSALLDAGANLDCKSWHLLQFSLMGALFAESILRKKAPSVGLLAAGSAGEEELLRETLPLLKYSGLNFKGLVEGHQVPAGDADVIVCDGRLGDVTCKFAEGLLRTFLSGGAPQPSPPAGLLRRLRGNAATPPQGKEKSWRPADHAAAPYLGVDGAVVLCRTPGDEEGTAASMRLAAAMAKARLQDKLRERLQEFKNNVEISRLLE